MEFYIIKRFLCKLINEIFYYLKKLIKKAKMVFKIILFVFIAILIYYIMKVG